MKHPSMTVGAILGILMLCTAVSFPMQQPQMTITSEPWGLTADGKTVTLFTLKSGSGMTAKITNYGGIIVSLTAPDSHGRYSDVVLGFDNLADYLKKNPFFGCITGRFANRIAKGQFSLEGKTHQLATKGGPNHLHGGIQGFDKRVWNAETRQQPDRAELILTYLSPDGEEGYPGNLFCTVTYTLTADNALEIHYEATTDKATVLNLTNHSFFNLSGKEGADILDHELQIHSDHYTPTDETQIPTGEIASVIGTPLDFIQPHTIGERLKEDFESFSYGLGYDHNYILRDSTELKFAARVHHSASGRILEVFTTQPGMQFYSGNHLKNVAGKGGQKYEAQDGFCLETQHYPDSPNQPTFPSTVLKPGEKFDHRTIFKFSADKL